MAANNFLLTGCASGMGLHLTSSLVRRGARVLATDVNYEGLERVAREMKWPAEQVLLRRLDVRDAKAWDDAFTEAVAAFGGVDVVMNIAGYLRPGWVHETTAEDVHRQFDINTKGVIFGTQAAARHMVPRKSGHIINISSMAGLVPVPGLSLYSASKYAVRAFSLAAGQELRQHGVAVTALCPDAVQTPMLELQKPYEEAAMTFSGGRVLTVEDIESAVFERILPRRPRIVVLPRARGMLARLADIFPMLPILLWPFYRKKGRAEQQRLLTQGH